MATPNHSEMPPSGVADAIYAIEDLAGQVLGMIDLLDDHVDFADDQGAMTALQVMREKARAIVQVLYQARQRERART